MDFIKRVRGYWSAFPVDNRYFHSVTVDESLPNTNKIDKPARGLHGQKVEIKIYQKLKKL